MAVPKDPNAKTTIKTIPIVFLFMILLPFSSVDSNGNEWSQQLG